MKKNEYFNNSISYCVTVCNEVEEFSKLIKQVLSILSDEDELLVLLDSSSDRLEEVKTELNKIDSSFKANLFLHKFEGDFAKHKNELISHASANWILQLDADELLSDYFAKNIKKIIQINSRYDMLGIPRENTLDSYPTNEEVQRWKWKINSKGLINWPDYQYRLFRNSRNFHYSGAVHEYVVGPTAVKNLQAAPRFAILHPKSLDRQRKQNALYDEIEANKKGSK